MNICLGENKIKNRLLLRAKILAKIRRFFALRHVTEVDTPLLLPATNPTPYLENFCCDNAYLQTSPEFAMKRLLSTNSGDIYQICKAFRKNELGQIHNPEFTMLEWYRINFDHHKLMDETDELLQFTIKAPPAKRYTYYKVCKMFLDINPHQTNLKQLKAIAKKHDLLVPGLDNDPDVWLQLLFTHLIEPKLDLPYPVFIYDFPASQAMLARIRPGKTQLASRFEVYYKGVELGNGFHELNNATEQRRRFMHDLVKRKKLELSPIPLDEKFLKSLPKLPNCSGIALGVDRLIMIAANATTLDDILCFRD